MRPILVGPTPLPHTASRVRLRVLTTRSYLKYDNCGEINLQSYAKYQTMRDALNATERLIEFSFKQHIYRGPPPPAAGLPTAARGGGEWANDAPLGFDGPFIGVPEPDSSNFRCGSLAHQPQPPMCNGSTCGHNSTLCLPLEEVMRRCAADLGCAGFANDTSANNTGSCCPGPNHFRAVSTITSINSADKKWRTWRKRGPPQPTGPTTYSWLPLVGNSWRSGNDIGSQ